jgi:hypothetical protein
VSLNCCERFWHAPTANAKHLATKAVVGLFPPEIYGKTIWLSPEIGGRVGRAKCDLVEYQHPFQNSLSGKFVED